MQTWTATAQSEEKREIRNTHRWNDNTCVICGCYRLKEVHPINKNWTLWKYYDPETGAESRKVYCKTNQLLLL